MSITPQNQILNQQVTALQHQIQNAGGSNSSIHREVIALKNDIAANKNSAGLNERMKKINNMIVADRRTPHQSAALPAAAQPGHYQSGHYQPAQVQGGHFMPGHYEPGHFQPGGTMPNQTHMQSTGPSFSQNQSSHLQYGLRQMSATLNIHPKF